MKRKEKFNESAVKKTKQSKKNTFQNLGGEDV